MNYNSLAYRTAPAAAAVGKLAGSSKVVIIIVSVVIGGFLLLCVLGIRLIVDLCNRADTSSSSGLSASAVVVQQLLQHFHHVL